MSRTHRGSLLRFFRKKEEEEKPAVHRWSITKKKVLSVSSSPGGSVGWVDREEGAPPVGESGFFFFLLFFHSLTIRFLPKVDVAHWLREVDARPKEKLLPPPLQLDSD